MSTNTIRENTGLWTGSAKAQQSFGRNAITMNRYLTLAICPVLVILISGCTFIDKRKVTVQNCSNKWYAQVEERIDTGDDQDHGPDIGSTEWRSVIEFKLGIRGDAEVPSLESEHWCNYINENFIDKST